LPSCGTFGQVPLALMRALYLADPLEFEGASYDRLVAHPRDESSTFGSLLDGLTVEANCYGIPVGEQLDDPFDHGWWRGGLGLVGTLRAWHGPASGIF
jgi:hypothetical protein